MTNDAMTRQDVMFNDAMSNMEFDLEHRVTLYASRMRSLLKQIPLTHMNKDDIGQVLRSSGSVGANYFEANDAVSKKDFYFRLRIARKEAKETMYWLRILDIGNRTDYQAERDQLLDETTQLMRIFSAIIRRSEVN